MKKILSVAATLLFACQIQAQVPAKQWTLEECIQYAIENNIEIKQIEIEHQSREVALSTSRNSWLPDLNASVNQNFDFGRSPSQNAVIVDQNSANTSAGLYLSMPIFDGLLIINDIAARKLDLQAATESLNKAKEDLSIGVASYYLQVLYNREIQHIAEFQLQQSTDEVTRTEAMVNAGKVPLSQLYDIKAQQARDEATLTEARNNVNLALLDLAQSLEMERSGSSFDIMTPDTDDAIGRYMESILPPENIYANAVSFKPQIKEQEYLLESQKKMLKVARAGYFPKINLNASYTNGYYHYYNANEPNVSFSDQISRNERKTIGLSLSIPLFNRFTVRNNVRTARLNIQNRELLMENSKKTLYKEIQQAYYNATAAMETFLSSGKSVIASQEAFKYAQERYSAGKSSVFEFNEARTNLSRSLAEQSQAKFSFIFRAKILDFYNGIPITL